MSVPQNSGCTLLDCADFMHHNIANLQQIFKSADVTYHLLLYQSV